MSDTSPSRALEGDAALVRAVGTFVLTAAVINVIVGGGIFQMPSALSKEMGVSAPLALVAGALAIIPVALPVTGRLPGMAVTTPAPSACCSNSRLFWFIGLLIIPMFE